MRTQGQAQAAASALRGMTPAVPGDGIIAGASAIPGDAAVPGSGGTCGAGPLVPARRPLRRTFRGEVGHVPLARDFVRRYLGHSPCSAEAVQDILVCTTELAANAVLHSRSGLPGGHFSVAVTVCAGQWVRVAVEDLGGPWTPCEIADGGTEGGRGLGIVSALSADMGITGGASGRTAWFRCRCRDGED